MKEYISPFICENDCGSPSYAVLRSKWIFETNRFELRFICGGCDFIQSKKYSDDLVSGKVKPPIYDGHGIWYCPDDVDYKEALHYSEHEKLLSIRGLTLTKVTETRTYHKDYS